MRALFLCGIKGVNLWGGVFAVRFPLRPFSAPDVNGRAALHQIGMLLLWQGKAARSAPDVNAPLPMVGASLCQRIDLIFRFVSLFGRFGGRVFAILFRAFPIRFAVFADSW